MTNIQLPIQYVPCKSAQLAIEKTGEIEEEFIRVYASDETPIVRFSWEEWDDYLLIFSHNPEHIKLERVANGVCLFFQNHPDSFFKSDRIGKAKKAELIDGHLELSIKLGTNEAALRYKKDLDDDIAPGISIGAQVYTAEVVQEAKFDKRGNKIQNLIMKAIDWELVEVSAVDIPGNPNARVLAENVMKFSCNIIGSTGLENMSKPQSQKSVEPEKHVNNTDTVKDVVSDEHLEELRITKIQAHYWKLRSRAGELLSKNLITDEDFALDFTSEPEKDIEKLTSMEAVDSRAEFKVIERSLMKAEKAPIQRDGLSEDDRTLLSNETIAKPIENKKTSDPATPNGSSVADYVASITGKLGN